MVNETAVIPHRATRVGRPTSYRPELGQEMLTYFTSAAQKITEQTKTTIEDSPVKGRSLKQEVQTIVAELPTFQRFANSIGVWTGTMIEWSKKYPEFQEAYRRCSEIQEDFMLQGLISGRIPGMGGIFVAKNITRFTDDRTLTVSAGEAKERPALADRTPQQLEALKALALAAEAAGVRVQIMEPSDPSEK